MNIGRSLCMPLLALFMTGCSGLNQFPEKPVDVGAALKAKDPAFAAALAEMAQPGADPIAIRNRMIDEQLRVIDIEFREFQRALARENVTANFGVGAAQVAIGAAGALVHETASQILSALSAILAGTQTAYSKAALYEQTMSALLAQMIAARNSVLVRILEGRGTSNIDEYPLSIAARDLEAYYFAGSLPGAVVATSADAKVKNDSAEKRLDALRDIGELQEVTPNERADRAAVTRSILATIREGDLTRMRTALKLLGLSGLPQSTAEDAAESLRNNFREALRKSPGLATKLKGKI